MAHGRISIGVNNLIITAFGRDNFRVTFVIIATHTSVQIPNKPPVIIIIQSILSATIDEIRVRIRYMKNEVKIEFGRIGDLVSHHACARFSMSNLWIGFPHKPAASAGAIMKPIS